MKHIELNFRNKCTKASQHTETYSLFFDASHKKSTNAFTFILDKILLKVASRGIDTKAKKLFLGEHFSCK